eukprot:TRINITY_DN447_c0_g1_i1.p1 TRINITY_DN447_c0_g1~~TRINITY_DN447_c0_g1_i1.p1  ORF type:complete len:630 (-),score=67.15 TRINITY_DN447_c0_g1_i1:158-2047(-)
MADETNENRLRRMDLSLCLGLPRLPNRRSSDLGSDLALGSISLPGEEIRGSAALSGVVEAASDPHTPYSPSHASYTPISQPVEPLNPNENPQFEFSPYSPSPQTGAREIGSVNEYSPFFPHISVAPSGPQSVGRDVSEQVEHDPYSPSYAPALPPTRTEGSLGQDGDSHDSYSPSYIPLSTTGQALDDDSNGLDSPLPLEFSGPFRPSVDSSESLVHNGSSQDRQRFSAPADRFRRIIESTRRSRIRRFRSAVPYRVGTDFSSFSERVFHDAMESGRTVETSGTDKENEKGENLEEGETTEQSSSTANFDCNICLDMAKEPVVTSCGHLFCWPCLYQWLKICDHKECPVCKGEVTGSNVTPIYGRGSSETVAEKNKGCDVGGSSLKIPPRPHGHRIESFRQRIRRPLSRRMGEDFNSWRRIVDEEIRNGNRVDRLGDLRLSRIFDNHRVYDMLRNALHAQREDNLEHGLSSGGTGLSVNATQNGSSQLDSIHREPSSPPVQDGIDFFDRTAFYSFPTSSRLAAQTAGISSVAGRLTNNDYAGASASVNLHNAEILHGHGSQGATPAADQASNSSTMAVIQGDVGVRDASAEPNSVESSRSLRRSRRNGASSSLDVDGGLHHARKRRRLN